MAIPYQTANLISTNTISPACESIYMYSAKSFLFFLTELSGSLKSMSMMRLWSQATGAASSRCSTRHSAMASSRWSLSMLPTTRWHSHTCMCIFCTFLYEGISHNSYVNASLACYASVSQATKTCREVGGGEGGGGSASLNRRGVVGLPG